MSSSMKALHLGLALGLPLHGASQSNPASAANELVCSAITTADTLKLKWGGLSGLSADHKNPDRLYAVHDQNFPEPEIYTLDVSERTAVIVSSTPVLHKGKIPKYDLEGISRREDGGFWLASEGKPGGKRENLIIRVADNGEVQEEVGLPDKLRKHQAKNGFEGISGVGSGDSERVAVAFQRPWKDDPKGMVKIGLYWPASKQWRFFRYQLEHKKGLGLSSIMALNNRQFAVLERDNKPFSKARTKRIYSISLPQHPEKKSKKYQVLDKTLLADLLTLPNVLTCGSNGKLEGMTVSADKRLFLANDDDGKGDTMLLRLDRVLNP